jgi:hypothetical protein
VEHVVFIFFSGKSAWKIMTHDAHARARNRAHYDISDIEGSIHLGGGNSAIADEPKKDEDIYDTIKKEASVCLLDGGYGQSLAS